MLGITWVLIILLYAVFVLTGSLFLLQKLLSVLSCLWCLQDIALLFANQLFKVNPCYPVAVYLPAQAISTSPDFTKAWGSQTAISTTDTWTDINFIPLLSCGGGGRFSLPPGEDQNLAFPSGLGKIWNRSGVKREFTGCVLHGGEEMSVFAKLWGDQWRVPAEKKKKKGCRTGFEDTEWAVGRSASDDRGASMAEGI